MSYSSQSSSAAEESISEVLNNFAFRQDSIYSHKNKTVFVNSKNYSHLEDIINYELRTQTVQDNGFLVIRLSSALVPKVTDSSMSNFLITGGDHEGSKQHLTPTHLNLINMGFANIQTESSGIFFTKRQLSHVSGNDRVIVGQLKTSSDKNILKSVRGRGKCKKVVGADDNDNDEESNTQPSAKKTRFLAAHLKRMTAQKRSEETLTQDVNVEPDTDSDPAKTTISFIFANSWENGLPWGKLVDGAFPEGLTSCPCGHPGKCLVDVARVKKYKKGRIPKDYIMENEREPAPLLHEAYVHYKRLKDTISKSIAGGTISQVFPERPYESDLLAFESVLRHMLISPNYSYNYLMHGDFVEVESNEGGYLNSMSHYDMGTHKNFLDECIDGTWDNGISYPWTYTGFSGSLFTTHVEDLYCLNSINLMLYGGTKLWIFVSPKHKVKLQERAVVYMNEYLMLQGFAPCTLVHKHCFLHPGLLDFWEIPYKIFIQRPGDLVVTAAGSFHWGINLNVNLNYAKNAIYWDYQQFMLGNIYNPHMDRLLCKVSCGQRMDDMIGLESNHKFLRAFYYTIFKNSDPKINALIETYYNICHDMTPEVLSLEQEINVHLCTALTIKEKDLSLTGKTFEKFLAKLTCDIIKLHREEITISEFGVSTSLIQEHWFPNSKLKLTTAQEDCIFNEVPYTHIMVTHAAYPNWRNSLSCSTNEKEEDGVVTRYFQYYKQIIEYWTSIKNKVDYEKVNIHGEDLRENPTEAAGTQSNVGELELSVSTEIGLVPVSSLGTHSDEIENLKALRKWIRNGLPRTTTMSSNSEEYTHLKTCGKLSLYEVNKRLHFICTLCYDNLEDHLDTAIYLHNEQNLSIPLPEYLEQTMKKKNGVFSEIGNLRHHIHQNISKYQCLLCAPCFTKPSFKTKYSLAYHIRDTHQHHILVCPLCNKEFNQPSKLRRHWSSPDSACIYVDLTFEKRKEVKVETCMCSVCKFQFVKIEEWKKHMKESNKCRVALGWVSAPRTITVHEMAPTNPKAVPSTSKK